MILKVGFFQCLVFLLIGNGFTACMHHVDRRDANQVPNKMNSRSIDSNIERNHLIDSLNTVAKVDSENPNVFFDLGVLYLKHGELEKAKLNLRQAYDRGYSDKQDVLYNLGIVYYKLDDPISTIFILSDAIKIDSSQGKFFLLRGAARLWIKDTVEACQDFNAAYSRGDSSASTFLSTVCK